MEPIFQRLLSYQKVFSKMIKRVSEKSFFFIKNINQHLLLNFKKVKYKFELKREYYYLGKYLSNLDDNKYDLSHDKIFINHINNIRFKKDLMKKNEDSLSVLSVNQETEI